MRFSQTSLCGAYIIDLDILRDDRGFLARSYCRDEFKERGLNPDCIQCNISFNAKKGTVRGMHFQIAPMAEAKLVRCTRGAIYDVIIDLHSNSPTYRKWFAVELDKENHRMLYIPEGFVHGFQTLTNNTEVFYQMSEVYSPQHARGIRWNDPAFSINWPLPVTHISEKDMSYPDFSE